LPRRLTKADYEALARFRHALRKFLRFSEEQARSEGLTGQQYQAMLAVRGAPNSDYATVGEIAERLQIKHHSTGELIDRLERAGLVRRSTADHDRRVVCVYLTEQGERVLDGISASHAPQWLELARVLQRELDVLIDP
jgi:DNA-binding MarR family transcriptional regulator